MDQNNAVQEQEAKTDEETRKPDNGHEQNPEKPASMESLLEEEGLGLDFPKQGEIRKGVVASIGETEILVSIGTKSEGVIPVREFEQLEEDDRSKFAPGNEITVYVVSPEDQNGNVLLSYLRAREEQDWIQAEALFQSGDLYEGQVIGFNKGGLIVPMGHLRGFIPSSQVSVLRRMDAAGSTPEQRWGSMVGDTVQVQVIEVDRQRRRLILSERSALQETRESLKDRLLDELGEGDTRSGRVTSLAEFGAFVNIQGADGLVHLSEISWDRIEHPREVLKVGQEVQVKVIAIDHERKRIGLSIRQLQEDPWIKKVGDIREGQLVEGTITHITKFGAFARISEDLEGLIHISELSEQRVGHPKEIVREDDVVTLRVIKIDPERRRIGLSLRKVDSPAYTDLDWKTTLAEVVAEKQDEEQSAAIPSSEDQEDVEQPAPSQDTEVDQPVSAEQEQPAPSQDTEVDQPVSAEQEQPASSQDTEVDQPVSAEQEQPAPSQDTEVDQPVSAEQEQPAPSQDTEVDQPVSAEQEQPSPEPLQDDVDEELLSTEEQKPDFEEPEDEPPPSASANQEEPPEPKPDE